MARCIAFTPAPAKCARLPPSPPKASRASVSDGRLWFTENEGGQWTEITANIPPEARGKWVARIEPSHFDAEAAYVVFTGYRAGDDTPYIYRLSNLGKDWMPLSGDLATSNPAIVVREDPVNRNLLYAGTEFGLFVSVNGGTNWLKFGGLPSLRVDDLKIQAREADLVIATHGRSLYVLDDTRALRELTPAITAKDAHLFTIRPTHGKYLLPGWEDAAGKGWFQGKNPPEGALLTVWFREFTGEKFSLIVANSGGQSVAKFEQVGMPGLTRLNWDLRVAKEFRTEYGGDKADRFVPPGDYTAELSYKETKVKRTFKVSIEEGIATHGTFRGN